jgi:hypothetical protein
MTTNKAIDHIQSNNLIGLKAGSKRETFLEIWMVVVANRIFARSWGFAEKSWYNTFLADNKGQIKCGDTIYKIEAVIPKDLYELTEQVNAAYLNKYNFGSNAAYAQGIIEQKHIDKTMEFILSE